MADPAMAKALIDATPLGRLVEADEVAAAIVFLASDAAHWLKPKERMVVLHDRALLDQLTRLKPVAEAAEAAE